MRRLLCMAAICLAVLESTQLEAAISHSGMFTTDSTTGLDWLDLEHTLDKSFDEVSVLLGAGIFVDLRFATEAEVIELVNNTGFNPAATIGSDTDGTVNDDYLSNLVMFLGSTGAEPELEFSKGFTSTVISGQRRYVELYDTMQDNDGTFDYVYSNDTLISLSSVGQSTIASFLVRDGVAIPEPTALTLAALGLLGMSYRRKRSQEEQRGQDGSGENPL